MSHGVGRGADAGGRLGNLNVISYNIRSLRKNLDLFLTSIIISKYHILAFSETWVYPHEEGCYGIPGFKAHFVSNSRSRGGGIAVYVRADLHLSRCSP